MLCKQTKNGIENEERLLPQQGELARQNTLRGDQPVEIDAAGQDSSFIVAAVPVKAVAARLLVPLAQDRHPLSGQGEQLQASRTGCHQEVGNDGLAVERVGSILEEQGFIRQAVGPECCTNPRLRQRIIA